MFRDITERKLYDSAINLANKNIESAFIIYQACSFQPDDPDF